MVLSETIAYLWGRVYSKYREMEAVMETRVALLSIIVENTDAVEKVNELFHEYGSYIIGRMGIPYKEKNVNIICIAIDAPMDAINALTGALGRIDGINAKATYSNV